MPTNRLGNEKSPYLLQHQNNPVDWYPWGQEAFDKAKSEDKPIFLSIGYSTCHWCHVMERESFESEQVAGVLNQYFVPIKVDREERPDVDRIYMTFVQATTGSGGWPMSVWLTPSLKPFFGGTYFPPDNRYGRPGFRSLLEHLADAWREDRERIEQSSVEVMGELRKYTDASEAASPTEEALDRCFHAFRRSFDSRLGGFGGAPKFPRPSVLNFLLRYYKRSDNEEALEMVLLTLREMAKGGMNDQLAGGFHRYSVDERWFVPHFEKMLYDQAQLAVSYVEAFQITGEEQYARTARETLDYVLRDMTHPEGGFYSAEDADSIVDPAHPHEKGEGAFYIWSYAELVEVLGEERAALFAERFGAERGGNVRHDPQGEFTGRNILYLAQPSGESSVIEDSIRILLERRALRPRPHLDDKVLTAWNGLMISAFARAAQALDGGERYAEAAQRAASFVLKTMYRDGRLLRRFREGETAINGFLDDYAFFANALLDLYETTFNVELLRAARELALKMIELFEDAENGAFFSTEESQSDLVLRIKDDYDGAEPASNSIAILLLLRLSHILGDAAMARTAERALSALGRRILSAPETVPQLLVAYLFSRGAAKQIVIAPGGNQQELIRAVHRRFVPQRVLLLADGRLRSELGKEVPAIADMTSINGSAAVYVCENYACQLPVTNMESVERLLQ